MAETTYRPVSDLKRHIHFIGVGGIGMSALALLLAERGYQVSGSDMQRSANTDRVLAAGGHITIGHSEDQLKDAEVVVVSTAIKDDNVELRQAKATGVPILHRSDVLKALLDDRFAVTIAGTHGKTTTTCLIAHMLNELGLAPGYAAGGRLLDTGRPAADAGGKAFVAEVDESDGTLTKYTSDIAVITNIEPDHLDFFGSFERMKDLFAKHIARLRKDGCAILGWDDPVCRELSPTNKLGYGFVIGADVRGLTHAVGPGFVLFEAMVERQRVKCKLPLIGKHNVQNALAALACARAMDLNVKSAAEALETFPGVARRMACTYSSERVKVFDDYAHNPGKIASALDSAKASFPDAEIIAVFQPHRYSRLNTMFEPMLKAAGLADEVMVLPVYAAGEPPQADFSPTRLAAAIKELTTARALPFETFAEVTNHLVNVVKSDESQKIIITVGAGDVWKVAEALRDKLS